VTISIVFSIELAGGSESLSPVLDKIFTLTRSDEVASAYETLSPDSYGGVTNASYNTTTKYLQTINSRMAGIRAYGMTSGSTLRSDIQLDKTLLLAYNGSDASIAELYDTGQRKQAAGNYGVWIDGFGKWGDQNGKNGYTGFDYNLAGGAIGIDYLLGNRTIIGVSGGYSYTDIDLDSNNGSGTINSNFASLYGSYFTKEMYLETSLAYSWQRFSNNRNVVVGSLQNTAHSDHDGNAFAASLEGGYNFDLGKLLVQPIAALQYINLEEDGFTETGAGSVNLIIDDRSTESLTSDLGLRFAKVFPTDFGSLIPELRVTWKHDFEIDDQVITAAFKGAPNVTFDVPGQDMDSEAATVSVGMTLIQKNGFSTNLKYDAELRDGYSSNGLFGELRYAF